MPVTPSFALPAETQLPWVDDGKLATIHALIASDDGTGFPFCSFARFVSNESQSNLSSLKKIKIKIHQINPFLKTMNGACLSTKSCDLFFLTG